MVCSVPSSQAAAAILSSSVTSDEEALQAQMPYSQVVTGDEVSCRPQLCRHDCQQPEQLLCSKEDQHFATENEACNLDLSRSVCSVLLIMSPDTAGACRWRGCSGMPRLTMCKC